MVIHSLTYSNIPHIHCVPHTFTYMHEHTYPKVVPTVMCTDIVTHTSMVTNSFIHIDTLMYNKVHTLINAHERLLLTHEKIPGFLASGGEEFNPGPKTRLDHSELLCNKVLLKHKEDRESF